MLLNFCLIFNQFSQSNYFGEIIIMSNELFDLWLLIEFTPTWVGTVCLMNYSICDYVFAEIILMYNELFNMWLLIAFTPT